MSIQAPPASQAPSITEEQGKLVLPRQRDSSKEYPKEMFYSFFNKTGVDKLLTTKLGEMDLNETEICPFQPSCGYASYGSFHESRGSSGSFSLPKILEGSSSHDSIPHKKTNFPDITKYYDSSSDDDSDISFDSDFESDEFLADSPLNHQEVDDNKENSEEAGEQTVIRLLGKSSSHSLYELLDSGDEGSDWEVESNDDSIISC